MWYNIFDDFNVRDLNKMTPEEQLKRVKVIEGYRRLYDKDELTSGAGEGLVEFTRNLRYTKLD